MKYGVVFAWSVIIVLVLSGCAALRVVSFQRDVYPILEDRCLDCHTPPKGKGYRKTGLSMETHQDLMRGTVYGPVVKPGAPKHSVLLMLIEGRADASMRMPHKKDKPLPPEQIAIIRRWVSQGASDN